MSRTQKVQALIKLGIRNEEARALCNTWTVRTPGEPAFTTTFGVEIETVNCRASAFFAAARENGLEVIDRVYYNHDDMPRYKLVPDSSLSGSNTAECVTPALNSDNAGFKSLENCCKSLNQIGAGVNRSCGLHVHIGAADLTEEQYINVFVNYKHLESAIDSFMAESRRGNNSQWCQSLRSFSFSTARTRRDVQTIMYRDRYYKVNPMSWDRHKTIEFRQHAGSTNYAKIKAWVKFLVKLVGWSRNHRLDQNISRIEDIPFLTATEKRYFISRRSELSIAA